MTDANTSRQRKDPIEDIPGELPADRQARKAKRQRKFGNEPKRVAPERSESSGRTLINRNLLDNPYRLTMAHFKEFWGKVQHRDNGCAVYPGGVFRVPRSLDCEEKRIRCEYVSWVYHFDSVQDGADVVVTCETKNCVNPHHLQKIRRDKPKATIKGFSHRPGDRPSKSRKVRVGNKFIPAFYISAEWKLLRKDVVERDKGICQYCGAPGSQADHIVPRGQGGLDALQNLVCCCPTCNKIANGRVFSSFEDKKAWILEQRDLT